METLKTINEFENHKCVAKALSNWQILNFQNFGQDGFFKKLRKYLNIPTW